MFLIVNVLVNVFVFSQRRGKLIYSLRYVIMSVSAWFVHTPITFCSYS